MRSPPMTSNLIMMGLSNLGTDRAIITSQEIRIHKPRPKIPPPSKVNFFFFSYINLKVIKKFYNQHYL